jgi:hypothetical protein
LARLEKELHSNTVRRNRAGGLQRIAHVEHAGRPRAPDHDRRDSEVHEIAPGSIVDHYGTPAIKSTKGKHDPNLPIKHWWITEPVAEAVAVAEQLSKHHDRLFPPLLRKSADVSRRH